MDITEQIYQLVKQWGRALNPSQASTALRQIAQISGCLPNPTQNFTEQEDKKVIRWLQENHPNAYLWAITQRSMGHPAIVWGAVSK